MDKLNWAVLGTGVVANQMAQAMQDVGRKLYAVGNRTHSKAVDFANKYGIEKVYDDLNDMFYDDNVDVIYITSPHNTHIDFIMKALENGKHILCEKSITLNSVELEKALKKADEKNLVLAEAMTIYHMPLYKKLMKLVENGEIGDVSMIQANFGSYKDYDMKNRFFNMNLAGGAMLDIGVYAISLARCFLKSKPDNVISTVKFAPSGVDEMSGIVFHCRFIQNNRKDVLYVVIRDISRLWNIRERVRRRLSAPKQASEKKSVRVKPKGRCSMKWRIWRRRFQSEAVVCLGNIQKTLWKL